MCRDIRSRRISKIKLWRKVIHIFNNYSDKLENIQVPFAFIQLSTSTLLAAALLRHSEKKKPDPPGADRACSVHPITPGTQG